MFATEENCDKILAEFHNLSRIQIFTSEVLNVFITPLDLVPPI